MVQSLIPPTEACRRPICDRCAEEELPMNTAQKPGARPFSAARRSQSLMLMGIALMLLVVGSPPPARLVAGEDADAASSTGDARAVVAEDRSPIDLDLSAD